MIPLIHWTNLALPLEFADKAAITSEDPGRGPRHQKAPQ